MATHHFEIINTRIKGIPFKVEHVYSTKKEFNGRSHLLVSDLGPKAFQDKIYYRLTDAQAEKYAKEMLKKAQAYVRKRK